jgi:hypothetical protein
VRRGQLSATLECDGRPPLHLELVPTGGRIFGGAFALEVSTVEPVLPRSGGVRARGGGVVRMQGVSFRPRSGDEAGRVVARGLEADSGLQRALGRVHFEKVRVEPDGRAVIRHLGGSLVWLLLPPMARPVPIGGEQVRATADALQAFAKAGQSLAPLAAGG